MSKSNIANVSKKLSLESKHLLDELGMISTKAADLIPRIYESLKHDGLEPSEIREFIEDKIKIGDRRLRQLLPPEAKRDYTIRKKLPNVQKVHNQARLVIEQEPTIPPPAEIHKEAEIIREPPKPITDKQTFILDPKTCKGWPCEKVYIYEVECKDGVATRMYSI